MDPALRAAASGMMAQQLRTEVISNNLANVNTTGFKRSRAQFEDLLYQTVQGAAVVGAPENQTQPAVQVGRGTRLVGVQRLHSQGAMETTNRPLDIAIEGEGFLQLQLPGGQTGYTRDGSLEISDQGVLVSAQGYTVQPSIKIPEDTTGITISRTGIVSVTRGQSQAPEEIGRLELARFANPAGLQSMGENVITSTRYGAIGMNTRYPYPRHSSSDSIAKTATLMTISQVVTDVARRTPIGVRRPAARASAAL